MEIRNLHRDELKLDNGLRAQRLVPWPALNAPFEGSWCVVGAGRRVRPARPPRVRDLDRADRRVARSSATASGPRSWPVTSCTSRPGSTHQVVNDGDADFEMYSIWWDAELAAELRRSRAPRKRR